MKTTTPETWNRTAREAFVWRSVHPDYKTHLDGRRAVLVFGDAGTALEPLDSMPGDVLERLSRRMGGR